MTAPPGRRERKKQLTRQAISDVATRLFLERGFDAVTVAEIAAAADVAVQTVFNHFPTKEDLFFDDVSWVTGPGDAVRAAPGEPPGTVLEREYRSGLDRRSARGYLPTSARFMATIEASPALRARRAHNAAVMQQRLVAALAGDREPDWRDRLFAARYAAVRLVLDDEWTRRIGPGDERAPAGFDHVVTEAFATLR